LHGSSRGEIEEIKEQDDVVLALKVLETYLFSLARGQAKVWGWTADFGPSPGTARQRER
jgi:hypothetical protein